MKRLLASAAYTSMIFGCSSVPMRFRFLTTSSMSPTFSKFSLVSRTRSASVDAVTWALFVMNACVTSVRSAAANLEMGVRW